VYRTRKNNLKLFLLGSLLISSLAFIAVVVLYLQNAPDLLPNAEHSDNLLDVKFYPNSSYAQPGEKSTFYFEITNKKNETVKKIDIGVDISYFGRTVYQREGASLRDYETNKPVTIYSEESLPIVTPPGRYLVRLSVKPENEGTRYLEFILYVKPSIYQLLVVLSVIAIFGVLILYFDTARDILDSFYIFVIRDFEDFSSGQKFVFIGVVVLVISSLTLAVDLESIANEFSIIAYLLLLVGVLNILLEYARMNNSRLIRILNFYIFSALLLLSSNGGVIGKTVAAFIISWTTLSLFRRNKNQKRIAGFLAIALFLGMLLGLLGGSLGYCATGVAVALILYAQNEKE